MLSSKDRITYFGLEYGFLSNFWPSKVVLDSVEYSTVEHAFQAAKTHDPLWRENIRSQHNPGRAKRLGRTLSLRDDWEEVKVGVMRDLLQQKFRAGGHLASLLLQTGEAFLLEGNTWHDNVWGSCCCYRCKDGGENKLGQLLMTIREELRAVGT